MNAPSPVAVILDMDGLMLDTEPISLRAWQRAARELGYELGADAYDTMVGLGSRAALDVLKCHLGEECPVGELSSSAGRFYLDALAEGGVPHRPGLEEFLRFLDRRRIPRAVATSTETGLAERLLRQAGILDRVGVVIGGDQVDRGKPAPDIFLLAANRLSCGPEGCVVLEDSMPGVRAAFAARMRAILVPDRREPSAEARALAHAVVESLTAAVPVVEQIIVAGPRRAPARETRELT